MKPSGFYVDPKSAAEGTETDAGADAGTVQTQKNPEAFPLQGLC